MNSPKFLERFQNKLSMLDKTGTIDTAGSRPVDFSFLPSPQFTPTNRSNRGTSSKPRRGFGEKQAQRSGSSLITMARKAISPVALRVKLSIDEAGPLLKKAKENLITGRDSSQMAFNPTPVLISLRKDDGLRILNLPLLSPHSRKVSPLPSRPSAPRSRHPSRPHKSPLSEIRCKHV